MDSLDSEMVVSEEENGCRFDDKERTGLTHANCEVNSHQEKVAGVLFCNML